MSRFGGHPKLFDGGTALIPFNRATTAGNEIDQINQAVLNGHISGLGPYTRRAEELLRGITGAERVLLTTSCTHALELAARVLGLGPGDEVIVPSFTFVSTASAIALTGAKPVFVDVLPETLNLNPDLVENAITSRTKSIFTVHYGGIAQGIDRLKDIADKNGLFLVEDNAHGLAGTYNGQALGTFGDLSTLSFHETKNISCGEGGALTFNSNALVEQAEILREKGTDRSRFLRGQVDKYTWVGVGSSWVLSDLLAAFLTAQLDNFDRIQYRRNEIWNTYASELQDWATNSGFTLPFVPSEADHPSHLFYLHAPNLESRSAFINHLKERDVMAVFHYQALNASKVGIELGARVGDCPVSERAADTLVRLPLYFSLSESDQDQVISAIQSFRA
jgi:dTDP-4-amino-4,6-dideoxygalactose transaminase